MDITFFHSKRFGDVEGFSGQVQSLVVAAEYLDVSYIGGCGGGRVGVITHWVSQTDVGADAAVTSVQPAQHQPLPRGHDHTNNDPDCTGLLLYTCKLWRD